MCPARDCLRHQYGGRIELHSLHGTWILSMETDLLSFAWFDSQLVAVALGVSALAAWLFLLKPYLDLGLSRANSGVQVGWSDYKKIFGKQFKLYLKLVLPVNVSLLLMFFCGVVAVPYVVDIILPSGRNSNYWKGVDELKEFFAVLVQAGIGIALILFLLIPVGRYFFDPNVKLSWASYGGIVKSSFWRGLKHITIIVVLVTMAIVFVWFVCDGPPAACAELLFKALPIAAGTYLALHVLIRIARQGWSNAIRNKSIVIEVLIAVAVVIYVARMHWPH